LHPEVEAWFLQLCRTDPASADLVAEAIDLLAEQGPALGRPLVDRLKGSMFHHMKELRPGSAGSTEIRMIFAFDRPGKRSPRCRRQVRTMAGVVSRRHSVSRYAFRGASDELEGSEQQ
jgi:hypothetical protein